MIKLLLAAALAAVSIGASPPSDVSKAQGPAPARPPATGPARDEALRCWLMIHPNREPLQLERWPTINPNRDHIA